MEKELENSLNWKEIGRRFRALRKQHALSQLEIIKRANNHKSSIAEFEAGTAPASTNYALFLRNEFGASFDWLYCGVNVNIPRKYRTQKRILDAHAIGARLKDTRKEKGMTQKQFAEWIGVGWKAIANYEQGICKPEIKTALLIRDALNKPLDWIYFGDEEIIPKSRLRANANQIKSFVSRIQEKVKVVVDVLHNYLQLFDGYCCSCISTNNRFLEVYGSNIPLRFMVFKAGSKGG